MSPFTTPEAPWVQVASLQLRPPFLQSSPLYQWDKISFKNFQEPNEIQRKRGKKIQETTFSCSFLFHLPPFKKRLPSAWAAPPTARAVRRRAPPRAAKAPLEALQERPGGGHVLMGKGHFDETQELFSNFQLLNCGSYLSQKHTSWNLEVGQFWKRRTSFFSHHHGPWWSFLISKHRFQVLNNMSGTTLISGKHAESANWRWPKGFMILMQQLLGVSGSSGSSRKNRCRKCGQKGKLHPGKSTWNPRMEVWKMIFLFNWVIFRFHVNFQFQKPSNSLRGFQLVSGSLACGDQGGKSTTITTKAGESAKPPDRNTRFCLSFMEEGWDDIIFMGKWSHLEICLLCQRTFPAILDHQRVRLPKPCMTESQHL